MFKYSVVLALILVSFTCLVSAKTSLEVQFNDFRSQSNIELNTAVKNNLVFNYSISRKYIFDSESNAWVRSSQPVIIFNDYSTKSKVVTVNNNKVTVSAFPNPTVDDFNISAISKISSVEIFLLDGTAVKTISALKSNEVNIDVSNLASGVYFCKVSMENTFELVKLIIQ